MKRIRTVISISLMALAWACQSTQGPVGPQGPPGEDATLAPCGAGEYLRHDGTTWACATAPITAGLQPASALESCAALYDAGVRLSGNYYIDPDGAADNPPSLTYCEMELEGGGWTLVYNSALGTNTTQFWHIPYAERLGRRGTPGLHTNYYDGELYRFGRRYMDVFEDLRGKSAVAFVATTTGISTASMIFASPEREKGHNDVYSTQFAGGWAAADFDGDPYNVNCATTYGNVTQHYGSCFYYNLGVQADDEMLDSNVGPHVNATVLSDLGLASDGTGSSRVRRISRFTRW